MRPISAELAAVQRVRSPRAEVTATVAARGQNPTAPAVAWAEIVPNTGQVSFYPAAVVGLADGSLLRFVGESSAIVQDRVSDPTTAAGWAAATRTTVRAHGAVSLAALRVADTIRLFYTHSGDGKVYGIESGDNGVTWGSPTTVYAGSDAAFDLVVAYLDDPGVDDGPWFVGFSTYNGATGEYTAHFGYFSGSWTTHALAVGWRAAGIDPYAPAGGMTTAGSHRVYVFRQHGLGPSRLRTYEHRRGSFTQPQDIDQTQAGLFGLILAFYRFCQLPAAGCLLGVTGETASGRGVYLGVTGIFHHGDPLVDEPIMLPAIATTSSGAYVALAETDGDLYLVGDTVVYRGAALPATAATLTPIAYTYDDHELVADFPAATPTLRIGQVLTLTRVLRWETLVGSADLAFSIVRVETGTARVRVWAVDAVGFLGIARCRRPAVLHDGTENNCARVMRRLAARFGVPGTADDAGLESAAVLPVTLQPSESLRGAVYRVSSQTTLYLVPDNSGAFAVTLINPPASDSGQYADTPHLYGAPEGLPPSEQPIAAATAVSDYRRLAFSYVLGTYSTDPEDGAALAMAAGPVIAGTRPLSYSLTNTRYNSFTRVQQAAVAEAARQHTLPVEATVEANANLALELYDVVQITLPALGWSAQRFRVRRIIERWGAGRLTQTLYLGAV